MNEQTTNEPTMDTPLRVTSASELLRRYAAGERDFALADLRGADLRGANLTGADLWYAYLTGAYLTGAYLTGADLTGANLTGADLTDANLTGAYLGGANLRGANLPGANLTGANLTGANLTGANLTGADLWDANLTPIRDDLYVALALAPAEAAGLLATLEAGQIDGSTYNGASCACLAGTIARLSHDRHAGQLESGDTLDCGLRLDANSPSERWFLAIRPGDTPANSPVAAITAEWIRAWMDEHPQSTTHQEAER